MGTYLHDKAKKFLEDTLGEDNEEVRFALVEEFQQIAESVRAEAIHEIQQIVVRPDKSDDWRIGARRALLEAERRIGAMPLGTGEKKDAS